MATGTLTLTQNSTAVTGSGTAFTSELSTGDVIFVALGGVNYSLVVSAVTSNISLTLARAFVGSTTSDVAWSAIPQTALIGIHAQLAADTAWSRRASILDKQNWQAIFSADGSITVLLPDGSSFTGPSWKSIVSTLEVIVADIKSLDEELRSLGAESLAKSNNLSDLEDRDEAWSNIRPTATIPLATYYVNYNYSARLAVGDVSPTNYDLVADTLGGNIIASIGGQSNSWGDWAKFLARQRTHFLTGDTDSPTGGVVFGFSTAHANANTGTYGFQVCGRNSSMWFRTAESGLFQSWQKLTSAAVCDAQLKHDIEDTDGSLSLANICAMELKTFVYNDDEKNRVRRGVVAQQIRDIDPCYVKEVHNGDKVNLVLDNNPLLLDALSAIKLLSRQVDDLKAEIVALKG